jgi:uncharacterized protein YijF (DUF1287 family)
LDEAIESDVDVAQQNNLGSWYHHKNSKLSVPKHQEIGGSNQFNLSSSGSHIGVTSNNSNQLDCSSTPSQVIARGGGIAGEDYFTALSDGGDHSPKI